MFDDSWLTQVLLLWLAAAFWMWMLVAGLWKSWELAFDLTTKACICARFDK